MLRPTPCALCGVNLPPQETPQDLAERELRQRLVERGDELLLAVYERTQALAQDLRAMTPSTVPARACEDRTACWSRHIEPDQRLSSCACDKVGCTLDHRGSRGMANIARRRIRP